MEFFLEDFSLGSLIILLIGAGFLLLFFYCLYDAVTSNFPGNEGMLWGLLIFFAPVIGALAYLVYGKQSKLPKQK